MKVFCMFWIGWWASRFVNAALDLLIPTPPNSTSLAFAALMTTVFLALYRRESRQQISVSVHSDGSDQR